MALREVVEKLPRISNKRPAAAQRSSNLPWDADAYATTIDQTGLVCVTDLQGKVLHVNDNFVRTTKYSRKELLGRHLDQLHSRLLPREYFGNLHRTLRSGKPWRSPICNRAKDGSDFWVDATVVPLKSKTGKVVAHLYFLMEIPDAENARAQRQDNSVLLLSVLNNFPGGIAVYDKDLNLVFCNEMQKRLMEYPPELFKSGTPSFKSICRFDAKRGEYGDGDSEQQVRARLALARKKVAYVYERERPNGLKLEVRGTPLPGGAIVTSYLDITRHKRDEETIARLAYHDTLTGLPNRRLMQDRMQMGLARVNRGETLALLEMGLDRFKTINELFGHPVGDKLLQSVAKRVVKCTRETDTVARIGGDEFAVILTGELDGRKVEAVARRIIRSVSRPYTIDGHSITVGANIGIAMAPTDGVDAPKLMANVDLALRRAKANGSGTFCFFELEMQERAQRRYVVQEGLRHALASNEFSLHYQPIVRIEDGETIGCEALLRWSHAQRGSVPASEFISIAEETGLIGPMGEWVLRKACADAKRWPDHVTISVNISPAQLRGQDFISVVTNALDDLDPSRLILEITESLLLQSSRETSQVLEQLRSMGVRFALDDFGTGFSSLSYLQSFPFDKIKIDRSFVSAAVNAERASTLRRSIAQLGRNLGMTTVAEGVETEEQLELLRAEGCMEAQGYLFSRPVPVDALNAIFELRTTVQS